MMGKEQTISDFVSKVLWCEEDDLGAGARFHLVKTSYINKMGLEIRDKIDLCERFELWPHSLSWWTTLVIGKWDRHFRDHPAKTQSQIDIKYIICVALSKSEYISVPGSNQ